MPDEMRNTVFLALVFLLSGCVNPFAPRLTNQLENADLIITPQKTPDEVLQNFKVAYAFRDSLLYSNLLDTGFMFVFFDPNEGTSGMFISWLRNDDLRTTGRLFRHFQVIQLFGNQPFMHLWIRRAARPISAKNTI